MMLFGKKITHESFGMVGLYRQTGRGTSLFGSSIKHGSTIALKIKRAVKYRDLHQDWFHGDEELIEVILSPNQFANLITSMNVGDGVPCTITSIGRKVMADCPSVETRAEYEKEFQEDVKKAHKDAAQIVSDVEELFDKKSNITKTDRKEILEKLNRLVTHIQSNMPFVHSQFNEAMDKTVAEARSEVESFVESKISSLGIDALNEDVKKYLSAAKVSLELPIEKKDE